MVADRVSAGAVSGEFLQEKVKRSPKAIRIPKEEFRNCCFFIKAISLGYWLWIKRGFRKIYFSNSTMYSDMYLPRSEYLKNNLAFFPSLRLVFLAAISSGVFNG